jgi:Fur family transcriptional regulator, ferric uptake regulator
MDPQPDEGPVAEGVPRRASHPDWTLHIDTEYHHDMDTTAPIDAALGQAGYRATAARRAVVDLITGRDGHFTAADLVDDAQRRGLHIGRATIFRTLDVLTELRAVERLDLPSGDHAYVACEPAHHHHVVCSRCGRSSDADDAGLRAVVRDIERQSGYRIDEHRLELFGLCPDCRAGGST